MEIPSELNKDGVLAVIVQPAESERVPYIKAVIYKDKVVLRYDGQDMEIKMKEFCAFSAVITGIHTNLHERDLVKNPSIVDLIKKLRGL